MGAVPSLVDVASPDTLLDPIEIDKDFNRLGEDAPDLGLLTPADDAVEMLDGLDLAGGGVAGGRRGDPAVAPLDPFFRPVTTRGRGYGPIGLARL